jgi:prepilin-type N-terminal cleavage/methylation domain-containing protein
MTTVFSRFWGKKSLASFTLIELLTVIAIIAILAALTLAAASSVLEKGRRSRAASEIQAMSTALEGYKTDNGIYPPSEGAQLLTNTPYSANDGSSTAYQTNATLLYAALSGTNTIGTPPAGTKVYMTFKANQLGTNGNFAYVKDPWNNAYGYSTGNNTSPQTVFPYNGSGFFDLWTTAGVTETQFNSNNNLTNKWISNWQ